MWRGGVCRCVRGSLSKDVDQGEIGWAGECVDGCVACRWMYVRDVIGVILDWVGVHYRVRLGGCTCEGVGSA